MNQEHDGLIIARERIAREAEELTGFLDLGRLGLRVLPKELFQLKHLQRLNLGAICIGGANGQQFKAAASNIAPNDLEADLGRLAELTKLNTLWLVSTPVSSLSQIANLSGLQSLDCSDTAVSDLSPLKGLHDLQSLHCSHSAVSDLSPLESHLSLQALDCSATAVRDLSPLEGLSALQELDCSAAFAVRDLSPLKGLTALQALDCSGTAVSDLSSLKELLVLQYLNCTGTNVSDMLPLNGLLNLQSLACSDTAINDLSSLKELPALQALDCSATSVGDLSPLKGLPALQYLNCSWCSLNPIPEELIYKQSLRSFVLYEAKLPDIPSEVLSRSPTESCLESLRAHLSDLRSGAEAVKDVKLMVLGNGRVGKTQICRRLCGQDYDEHFPSTHGIVVNSAPLPQEDGGELAKLHLWDFGGQDIYHGTHALFLRTRAVFMLVWSPMTENASEHEYDGMIFRNQPLDYWLAYARHIGGPDNPLLVLQTRCDRPEDEVLRPPVPDEALADFPFRKILHYSSLKDRGRAALNEALREAVNWLWEQQGTVLIGAGRLRVKHRLEALRDADAAVPPEERQYRTLTQACFRQLCEEEDGSISSSEHLLDYLHNAGVVFYRRGLFDDRIILDQGWALTAVYAVFNREKCYRQLRQSRGRFSRSLLELLVWQDYHPDEQQLFLDMMTSCGVCFVYREGDGSIEAEYIAPELLPEKAELEAELEEKWNPDAPMEEAVFEYELHHPGLLRSLVSQIGTEAGINGLYWKNGVCVYERTTRSRALIEQEAQTGTRGIVRLRTQGGQAAALLAQLAERITREEYRWGIRNFPDKPPAHQAHKVSARMDIENLGSIEAPKLEFIQEPASQPEYCVSYAWGDDRTEEGSHREDIVDHLCEAAEKHGIRILRDKTTLGLGERISKFMQRIGRSDQVFVILSDKYLKSPYCMFELFEVWRNARNDDEEFLRKVRVYSLPCANIFNLRGRAQYAVHWKREYDELNTMLQEVGPGILGESDFKQFKLMQQFALQVGDILGTVTDVLQPRSFEELERWGLGDAEPPDI